MKEEALLNEIRNMTPDSVVSRIEKKVDPIECAKIDQQPDNSIVTDAEHFSVSERRIAGAGIAVFEEICQAMEKISRREHEHRISQDIDDHWATLKNIDQACNLELDFELKRCEAEMQMRGGASANAEFSLKRFRVDNKLTDREASYTEHTLLHCGIMLGLIVIEAFLNTNYLSAGSDFGIVGGALQSISFSVLNLGFAGLIAWPGFKQLNHKDTARKVWGVILILLYLSFMLPTNLVIGHYVEALAARTASISDFSALSVVAEDAFSRFREGPLELTTMSSIAIAITGVVFSLLYLFEFSLIDDRYPGYRGIDRKREEMRAKLIASRERVLARLKEIHDRHLSEISRLARNIQKEVGDFKQSISGVENMLSAKGALMKIVIQAICSTIIKYRQEVLRFKAGAEETFGGNLNRIVLEDREIQALVNQDKVKAASFDKDLERMQDLIGAKQREVGEKFKFARDEFEKFYEALGKKGANRKELS